MRKFTLLTSALLLLSKLAYSSPIEDQAKFKQWELVGTLKKSTEIFTQGLEFYQGELWASSGKYQQSFIANLPTKPNADNSLKKLNIPALYFAEGLTFQDDTLILLTWRKERALRFQLPTMSELKSFRYHGEGWGLCFDGNFFWMSDGTDKLIKRDEKFEVIDIIPISFESDSEVRLNELECINGLIAANDWKKKHIYVIDTDLAKPIYKLDFSKIAEQEKSGVLNGIAWEPQNKEMWITGKNWNKIYRIKILVDLNNLKLTNQTSNTSL